MIDFSSIFVYEGWIKFSYRYRSFDIYVNEPMVILPILTYANYFSSVWKYHIYYSIGYRMIMNFISNASITNYILMIFMIYNNDNYMINVKKFISHKKAGSYLACIVQFGHCIVMNVCSSFDN